MTHTIPLHNFTRDDDGSIPFRMEYLEKKSDYDFTVAHRHNYYQIFIFIKGGGTHLIDFAEFPIADQSIHFLSPGQVHLLKRAGGSHGFFLLFSREFIMKGETGGGLLPLHPMLNNRSTKPIIESNTEVFSAVLALIEHIKLELSGEKKHYTDLVRLYLRALLFKSMQIDNFVANAPPTLHSRFSNLLEKHFYMWHRVSQYASALSTTEKHLTEVLKEKTGMTTQALINQRLVLEAKRLLKYSELSIKEISFRIGFDDPSHFTKFFKGHSGKTPSDFRRPVVQNGSVL